MNGLPGKTEGVRALRLGRLVHARRLFIAGRYWQVRRGEVKRVCGLSARAVLQGVGCGKTHRNGVQTQGVRVGKKYFGRVPLILA